MIASSKGDIRAVRLLIEANADVNSINKQEESALAIAIKVKNKQCIGQLVASNAHIYFPLNIEASPIFFAIRSKDVTVIESLLINLRGDTNLSGIKNNEGLNLIYYAYKYSNSDVVLYLAKYNSYFDIDISSPDKDGYTLLMKYVFFKKEFQVASQLIEYGANIDHLNYNGDTLMSLAVS